MENNFQFSTFHFPLFTEFFQHLPALVEASGEVETAFPLTALQREKHFAAAVEVAEPFGMLGVLEVAPGVVVDALEPLQALRVAGQAVALYRGDEGLDVYPPQLLVPLQLLGRTAVAIHEVEDASILFVPAVFQHLQCRVLGFHHQFGAVEALAQVHDEPHGLDGVAGIHVAAFEAVHQRVVRVQGLDDESAQLGTEEHVHHLVDAGIHGLHHEVLVQQVLYLQCQVAENHGQGEALQVARAGMQLVPLAFGVVYLGEDDVERLLGNLGILPVAGGEAELAERHGGKGVGEDVVGFHQGVAPAVEGEVPVIVAVVAVLLQELTAL